MAVTETAERVASVPADADPAPVGGLAGLLGTADHLVIGRLFLASSFVLLLVGRVAGILVDLERVDTGSVSVLDAAAGQVFSVHLVADTLLFLVPAFLGLAIALVPLQIGASTVAFPRAAAASFWAWLLSSGVLLASYLVDGGPVSAASDRDGALLWLVGLGGVATSLLLATVCVLTTALTLRTAGMGLDRVPMFTWGSVVAGVVWLLSLPVLVAAAVLGYVDVRYGADIGADGLLTWAFGVPQVFAFALPALGVLLDVVPVAAGTPVRNRGVLLGAVAVAGLLGFGADMLATGSDPSIFTDALYVGASFALLLPLLAVAAGVGDTFRRGAFRLNSPVLFAIGSLLLLLLAAALNAARVVDPLDLVGTSADSAVRELVVVAGLLGVAGAAHHWASKLFGTELQVGIGHIAALVLLAGGVVLGVPDFVSGLLDQPDGIVSGAVEDGVEALNVAAAAGGVLVLLGVVLLVVNVFTGRSGDPTPDDPWDGHTLEWATSSPPVPGRPGPVEPVTSATPLLDTKGAQA
jgi:heme/copper-type cytochrome/quinol oxidase subunit 1